MTKKLILVLMLTLIAVSGVFAETHYISGEASLFGVGARYEYMLSDSMSIGGNVYVSSFFRFTSVAVDGSFRYYPTAKKVLYVGGQLGFHYQFFSLFFIPVGSIIGVAITPEVGWKITDIGPKGFFISPGVKIPVVMGKGINRSNNFAVWFNVVAYIGLGYCF